MNDNGVGSMRDNEDVKKFSSDAVELLDKLQKENPHIAIIGSVGQGRATIGIEEFKQYLINNPQQAKRFDQCLNCWRVSMCTFDNEKYEDENGLCIKCETNEQRMANMIKELSEPKEFYIPERTGYQYEGHNRAARRRQKKSRK